MTRTIGKGFLTRIKPLRRSIIRAHPPRLQRTETLLEAALRRAGRTFPGVLEIALAVVAGTEGALDKADAIAPLEELIGGAARYQRRVAVATRAVRAWEPMVTWAQWVAAVVVAAGADKQIME